MAAYFWEEDDVRLRAFREQDEEQIAQMLADTEYRMQADKGIGLFACEKDAALFVQMAEEGMECDDIWLAVEGADGRCIGYCTMTDLDERNGHVFLFVTIFPDWQGKGMAKKAAAILLKYAFLERRLHKVNCCVMGRDTAGHKFAEALGFVEECVRTQMFYSHGRYYDEYYYGMLKEEYLACQTKKGRKEAVFQTGIRKQEFSGEGRMREKAAAEPAQSILDKLPSVYADGRCFWEYEGIRLRGMKESDCIKNHEILYDSEACRFYDNDVKLPGNLDKLTDFEREHLDFGGGDERIVFAIENEAGEYAGNVLLAGIDEKNGKFSFSIYICREMQNRGYGTKALFLALSYAFLELRMHKCVTTVSEKNGASLKLMKKLGFVEEGVWRENVYYNGNYVNDIFLGLTKARFCAERGENEPE